MTATVTPDNAATDNAVKWTSDKTDIATVEDGVITAVKAGTAAITQLTTGDKTATCIVTVTDKESKKRNFRLQNTTGMFKVVSMASIEKEDNLISASIRIKFNRIRKSFHWYI